DAAHVFKNKGIADDAAPAVSPEFDAACGLLQSCLPASYRELQNIVTTITVARVYDPRLLPLIERRYKKRRHYIL
ncbi:MAG TPA: hypothetical protein VMV34_08930, partial [Terriglobia bacterium]|nr:hypothetical protein [Terriglobia bacterium]